MSTLSHPHLLGFHHASHCTHLSTFTIYFSPVLHTPRYPYTHFSPPYTLTHYPICSPVIYTCILTHAQPHSHSLIIQTHLPHPPTYCHPHTGPSTSHTHTLSSLISTHTHSSPTHLFCSTRDWEL